VRREKAIELRARLEIAAGVQERMTEEPQPTPAGLRQRPRDRLAPDDVGLELIEPRRV